MGFDESLNHAFLGTAVYVMDRLSIPRMDVGFYMSFGLTRNIDACSYECIYCGCQKYKGRPSSQAASTRCHCYSFTFLPWTDEHVPLLGILGAAMPRLLHLP